jgi:hypothetical protein
MRVLVEVTMAVFVVTNTVAIVAITMHTEMAATGPLELCTPHYASISSLRSQIQLPPLHSIFPPFLTVSPSRLSHSLYPLPSSLHPPRLVVQIDPKGDNNWLDCVDIADVKLPEGWTRKSYIGLTASTGQLSGECCALGGEGKCLCDSGVRWLDGAAASTRL